MADELQHEEITARFLESGAVNFEAMGKFLGDIGPELASRDSGLHGVVIGNWFNSISCFLRPDDVQRLFGGLRGAAGLGQAVDIPVQR